MTGLEKILKAIEEDATAKAEAVLAQAEKEAEEIMSHAKLEAEKKCHEIAERSASDVQAAVGRAESAARLAEKKMILDAKQQIINSVITNARKSIAEMPVPEYEDLIFQMIKKHAHPKHGVIILSEGDRERLPDDLENRIKEVLKDKKGASLTISEETPQLNGGFILKYGDIEENCSFDALFSIAKENLQDKVNELLFD
ncbi:MAG: V-type ATP synthase subunit E [Peptostreptococcales bacterium]